MTDKIKNKIYNIYKKILQCANNDATSFIEEIEEKDSLTISVCAEINKNILAWLHKDVFQELENLVKEIYHYVEFEIIFNLILKSQKVWLNIVETKLKDYGLFIEIKNNQNNDIQEINIRREIQ